MSTADVLIGLLSPQARKRAGREIDLATPLKALAEGTRLDATYHVPFLAPCAEARR